MDEDIGKTGSSGYPVEIFPEKTWCLHPQDLHITVIDDFVGSPHKRPESGVTRGGCVTLQSGGSKNKDLHMRLKMVLLPHLMVTCE